jgi:acyl carrier protein
VNPWDEDFDELLRAFIPDIGEAPVHPDAEMVALGIDSAALLQLMLRIEDHYGIQFPMEMLNEEVFRTPRTIWAAAARLRDGAMS